MDHNQAAIKAYRMSQHAAVSNRDTPGGPLPGGALEAGVQIGDFRIERRLGAGGMGIVYQARQMSLNRPVALKVLGQALTRGTDVSRFQREAQAAARLRHPGIAQVYYIGQDRHVCYLAMELIEGASLRRILDRLGTTQSADSSLDSIVLDDIQDEAPAKEVRFDIPTEAPESTRDQRQETNQADQNPYLSPQARTLRTSPGYIRRVCELVRDAAQALAHAHEQGVIHRDIKPDNLLLDRQGKVHLIDFGVARFFDDQAVTYTGQLVGTPLYMSPEQVTGRGAIDARTDIYSLGLVLYEMLALRPPMEATNRENLLRTIVTKPLAPISWRNSAIKNELERVVHQATQKDPDQRYSSAADLAAELDRFLTGKPVEAAAYHFRLDEREITAARPGAAVFAAVNCFLVSVFLSLAFASLSLMVVVLMMGYGSGAGVTGGLVQLVIAVCIFAGGITVGRGILAAREWARWLAVLASGLITIASIGGLFLLVFATVTILSGSAGDFEQSMKPPEGGSGNVNQISAKYFLTGTLMVYAVPLVAGVVLGATTLWALLCRAVWQWFKLARDLRAEHRLLREQLA